MNEEVLKSFKELLLEAEEKYNDEFSKLQKDVDLLNSNPLNSPNYSEYRNWTDVRSTFEYYKLHKDDIILGFVSQKLIEFLSRFKVTHDNWEKSTDEWKETAHLNNYEEFYIKTMNNNAMFSEIFNSGVLGEEYEKVRNFIKNIFPTGEEIEIKEFYAHDKDDSIKVDELIIQIYDKVLGKSKYNYVTEEAQKRINTELYNNPNLSMEEWASLKGKQTMAWFYQGGVLTSEHGYQYPDSNRFDFENFQKNPEKFRSEYESWQRKMRMEEEKSGRSR